MTREESESDRESGMINELFTMTEAAGNLRIVNEFLDTLSIKQDTG